MEELEREEEEERERLEQEAIEKSEEKLREKKKQEEKNNSFELAKEAGKGFSEGSEGALFDLANGATFGGASKIDQKYFGGKISKMNDELENLADVAGVGNVYRGVQGFNEGVGAGLGMLGAKNIGAYGINEAVKWNGRRDLINQLERGYNFKDINFGKMNKDTLENINKLREEGGYNLLNQQTYIPANVVRKLYEKRLSEGYTPQEVTNIARDLFQKGRGNVTESRYGHIQQLIQPKENVSDVGYVAQNPNNGQTVTKSVYKKDNENILRNLLEGRRDPSSVVRRSENKPAVPARLSALQQIPKDYITPINNGVNSSGWENLVKNFEDTSSVGYVAQNKFMPKDNLSQGGLGQNGVQSDAFWQNPYNNIMPVKSREEEELEELLKKLRRMRRGW